MFTKNCATHTLHIEEQLILARDLSAQSLLLGGNFLYPVLAKDRSQILKILEKTIFNVHPVPYRGNIGSVSKNVRIRSGYKILNVEGC